MEKDDPAVRENRTAIKTDDITLGQLVHAIVAIVLFMLEERPPED